MVVAINLFYIPYSIRVVSSYLTISDKLTLTIPSAEVRSPMIATFLLCFYC